MARRGRCGKTRESQFRRREAWATVQGQGAWLRTSVASGAKAESQGYTWGPSTAMPKEPEASCVDWTAPPTVSPLSA